MFPWAGLLPGEQCRQQFRARLPVRRDVRLLRHLQRHWRLYRCSSRRRTGRPRRRAYLHVIDAYLFLIDLSVRRAVTSDFCRDD